MNLKLFFTLIIKIINIRRLKVKKIFSVSLIIIGVGMCLFSFYPIFEMNKEVGDSLDEWEKLKISYMEEDDEEIEKETLPNDLIGILTINGFNEQIPIRRGTTDNVLKKGIGLDETTVELGQIGNSVLYGHREKILWNLKDVKIDDEIIVETLTNKLVFKINDIRVVEPDDSFIYESSEKSTITLVTCYPFIYMGPTPQRYVVKAILVNQGD